MISISKKEMLALTTEYGVIFGENGISRTHSHNHHYFLCESDKNLKYLKDYRKKNGYKSSDIDRLHSIKRR